MYFQKTVSGFYIALYKPPRALYTNLTHTFIYFLATLIIEENMKTENELIKLGFEEADDIMCEDCGDAVATTLRGYGLGQKEVCSDCNCEMGF